MPEMIAQPLRHVQRGIFPAFMLLLLVSLALYALVLEMFDSGNAAQRVTHATRDAMRA
jgi:Tfp pilus assembly protein PilX